MSCPTLLLVETGILPCEAKSHCSFPNADGSQAISPGTKEDDQLTPRGKPPSEEPTEGQSTIGHGQMDGQVGGLMDGWIDKT